MIPCFGIREANAQSFRYEDAFSVTWPADLERSECVPFLKSHSVKDGCFQVGERGELGVVFVTVHPGYALGSEDLLERHLEDSEAALRNIPRVHVMQSRVLKTEPLLGLMEIERRDGTMNDIPALRDSAIRQTSILIPAGDKLAQIFIYLPMEGEESVKIYTLLMDHLISDIQVFQKPVVPEGNSAVHPEGTLSLMPKALWIGGIFAAFVILLLSVMSQIRRAQKKKEDIRMQMQIAAADHSDDPELDLDVDDLKRPKD